MKEETKNEKGERKTQERRNKLREKRLSGEFAKQLDAMKKLFAERKKSCTTN